MIGGRMRRRVRMIQGTTNMTTQEDSNKKTSGDEAKQDAAIDDRGDLPVGNASPRAVWPVYVLGVIWLSWIGFLVYLAAASGSNT